MNCVWVCDCVGDAWLEVAGGSVVLLLLTEVSFWRGVLTCCDLTVKSIDVNLPRVS